MGAANDPFGTLLWGESNVRPPTRKRTGGRIRRPHMRRLIAAATILVGGVSVGGTAFAGEVTGNNHGGPAKDGTTPIQVYRAGSICAFSGLEDGSEGGEGGPGNVQSFGA